MTIPPDRPLALEDRLHDIMTVKEVADLLRVSPLSVKRWGREKKEGFPAAIRINARGDRRYKKELILEFIKNNG